MVTKDSTAHLLPDQWKKEAQVIAQKAQGDMSEASLQAAILDLLDRACKEVVLISLAQLTADQVSELADSLSDEILKEDQESLPSFRDMRGIFKS